MNKKICQLIATAGGVGYIKVAPGTFGTLVSFPLIWILNQIFIKLIFNDEYATSISQILLLWFFHLVAIIILFYVGVKCSDIYSRDVQNNDPKEVVIDEVVGQYLLCWLVAPGILIFAKHVNEIVLLLAMFVFFRVFDIFKPWPISWFEKKFDYGFGIMIDDIIAGIFGAVAFYAFLSAV